MSIKKLEERKENSKRRNFTSENKRKNCETFT